MVKSKPKLIVQLSGGLGNQMFQYACARSLALRNNAELLLDNWSGFVRDFQYRRHYELGALSIQARIVKFYERCPIWLYRLQNRYVQPSTDIFKEFWYGRFIQETEFEWLPQLHNLSLQGTTWISGYWQSYRYFTDHASQIRTELMPPPSQQPHFLTISKLINDADSIALGVRLYEESNDPNSHSRDGSLKSAAQIRVAISRMRSERPNARFFVFCTHHSNILDELDLPKDSVYLTHDNGYVGTLERLWLLSLCRHHLFTNSSYYWWGAWLSAANWANEDQIILAADNFYYGDGLCPEWETF